MILNEEKGGWHYLAVKYYVLYYIEKISNNQGDFYCLNCPQSFRTENFSGIVMPKEQRRNIRTMSMHEIR